MNKKLYPVIALALLIVSVALMGCAYVDYSSTACCNACTHGEKTSVITVERHVSGDDSRYWEYVIDDDGIKYASVVDTARYKFDRYDNHNVTFTYHVEGGRYRIDEIIKDHTQHQTTCQPTCAPVACSNSYVRTCGCGC